MFGEGAVLRGASQVVVGVLSHLVSVPLCGALCFGNAQISFG